MKAYYRIEESTRDYKLDTLEDAQTEAETLAAKNPGTAFEILRCVGIAQTSKASTFWMDGEQPPERQRYRTLDDGEIIQEGDSFNYRQSGEWRMHEALIGMEMSRDVFPTRRPL